MAKKAASVIFWPDPLNNAYGPVGSLAKDAKILHAKRNVGPISPCEICRNTFPKTPYIPHTKEGLYR